MIREDAGAYVVGPGLIHSGAPGGELSGVSFTAKDLFDVEGLVTGAGNPTYRSERSVASTNADAVQRMLDAGADLVGTTISVEFAWSLTGRNPHDGLADNPADPYGVPGGSSAGAAAATAAGLCDVALGTDTGGSVRVPAAYCGLFGIRPTHGRVNIAGVVPLAPSFDTVGWFARDPRMLASVADVLLSDPPALPSAPVPTGVVVLTDAFERANREIRAGLDPLVAAVADQVGGTITDSRLADDATWERWVKGFAIQQGAEGWIENREFYLRHGSSALGSDVAARFEFAAAVTDADVRGVAGHRDEVAARLEDLTGGGTGVVLMPAAPTRAPRRARPETDESARTQLLSLTSIASLAGAPAVTLPDRTRTGTPVGLSLVGAPGSDEMLIGLAARVHELLSY